MLGRTSPRTHTRKRIMALHLVATMPEHCLVIQTMTAQKLLPFLGLERHKILRRTTRTGKRILRGAHAIATGPVFAKQIFGTLTAKDLAARFGHKRKRVDAAATFTTNIHANFRIVDHIGVMLRIIRTLLGLAFPFGRMTLATEHATAGIRFERDLVFLATHRADDRVKNFAADALDIGIFHALTAQHHTAVKRPERNRVFLSAMTARDVKRFGRMALATMSARLARLPVFARLAAGAKTITAKQGSVWRRTKRNLNGRATLTARAIEHLALGAAVTP